MGSTPANGLPWPDGSSFLVDGDNAIRALAEAVDKLLYRFAAGSQSFGTAIAGGAYDTRTVTFPTGRFTAAPAVTSTPLNTNPAARTSSVTSVTSTSFILTLGNGGSSSITGFVEWIAAQTTGLPAVVLGDTIPDTVATCHTDGCPNQDVAVPVATSFTDEDGNTVQVGGVECGACGQPITDLVAIHD